VTDIPHVATSGNWTLKHPAEGTWTLENTNASHVVALPMPRDPDAVWLRNALSSEIGGGHPAVEELVRQVFGAAS
jgi:hypothetical protein